jgi:C1A family cysteine protease
MFKVSAFLICAIFGISEAAFLKERHHYEAKFVDWMKHHGKDYASGHEFVQRLETFALNDDLINTHNSEGHDYKLGHNEYSDLTAEEFRQYFNLGEFAGVKYPVFGEKTNEKFVHHGAEIPDAVDWVEKKMVSEVKNQGQCGSCWAFSTTGSLESAYAIKNGKIVEFSEQQLVDCDHNGDMGCNGGLMDNAFKWIEQNKGLCTEEDYSYTAATGVCKTTCTNVEGSTVQKYTDVGHTDDDLMAALVQQPVSVAIEADQSSFQFYKSGVLTSRCGTNLDHGVLAVGYGTENGQDYYRVKNSWGTTWGDEGFIKLARGVSQKGGQCGILLAASFPSV